VKVILNAAQENPTNDWYKRYERIVVYHSPFLIKQVDDILNYNT
jgi:hypothetical protein